MVSGIDVVANINPHISCLYGYKLGAVKQAEWEQHQTERETYRIL